MQWDDDADGGGYTVTVTAAGQMWTWIGYADNRSDAFYKAIEAVERERPGGNGE